MEGILVRGDNDYAYRGKCQVALICPRDVTDCKNDGEDATSITAIANVFGSREKEVTTTTETKEKEVTTTTETRDRGPITKTFSSEEVPSGVMKSFSPEYTVVSGPTPSGYRIASAVASLTGDRVCNAWSICRVTNEGDHVVLRFSLQGHDEWPYPGQAKSQGHLVVTYAPK